MFTILVFGQRIGKNVENFAFAPGKDSFATFVPRFYPNTYNVGTLGSAKLAPKFEIHCHILKKNFISAWITEGHSSIKLRPARSV